MDLGHDLLQLVQPGFGVALHEMLRNAVPVLLRDLARNATSLDLVQPVVYGVLVLLWIAEEPGTVEPRSEDRLEVKRFDLECAEWVYHGCTTRNECVERLGWWVAMG